MQPQRKGLALQARCVRGQPEKPRRASGRAATTPGRCKRSGQIKPGHVIALPPRDTPIANNLSFALLPLCTPRLLHALWLTFLDILGLFWFFFFFIRKHFLIKVLNDDRNISLLHFRHRGVTFAPSFKAGVCMCVCFCAYLCLLLVDYNPHECPTDGS